MNEDQFRLETTEQIRRRADEYDATVARQRQIEAEAEQRHREAEYRRQYWDEVARRQAYRRERLNRLERVVQRFLTPLIRAKRPRP